MGIIIPAMVACACPTRGLVAPPSPGEELALTKGEWRRRTTRGRESEAFYVWAQTACSHHLVLAEAWPLLSDLLRLRGFLRGVDDPDTLALLDLAASFCRLPGEVGPLSTITVDIDERHRRALAGLGQTLVTHPAIYLVDSDTGVPIEGPAILNWESDPPVAYGSVLVENKPPGPPHAFYTPFDADGFRLEREGMVVFHARRVAQEIEDGMTRLVDLDSGDSVMLQGRVGKLVTHESGRAHFEHPARFHVETRHIPADYLASIREDLAALVDAALETGHPVRLPDRFG